MLKHILDAGQKNEDTIGNLAGYSQQHIGSDLLPHRTFGEWWYYLLALKDFSTKIEQHLTSIAEENVKASVFSFVLVFDEFIDVILVHLPEAAEGTFASDGVEEIVGPRQ